MDTTNQDRQDRTVDRFLSVIRPQRRERKDGRERKVVENAEFLAMLWRQVRALEARACEDPEMLPQVVALAQRLAEVVNVAIYTSSERYAVDPHSAASAAECARALGVSKQAASQRRQLGKAAVLARLAAAGAIQFAEARREKEARERAAEFAVTSLAEYRQRAGRHRASA